MSPVVNSSSAASKTNSFVTSTSMKSLTPGLYNDTRSLLDGCGLNIPSSLSITLAGSKSANPITDPVMESMKNSKEQSQNSLDNMNPTITLNDKSVDPNVLKALKTGQMQMPANVKSRPNLKITAKTPTRAPTPKRKKDDKPDTNSIKIPAPPTTKYKPIKSKSNKYKLNR